MVWGLDQSLERLRDDIAKRFERERRVLSFEEYLALVRASPATQLRDASRYLLDCLEHFGVETVERPWGPSRRFRAFDPASFGGAEADALVGQEAVQEAFHRALVSFARDGHANRLVLLHGPNGSAKSTFVACLMRALEAYARTDAGAMYRFSWVFPRERDGKPLGFGSASEAASRGESFAHLPDDRIQAKIPCELREHPLLLIPARDRRPLLEAIARDQGLTAPLPTRLREGELGQKNRRIFDALLNSYRGDLARVLAHVQVERIEVSKRYRTAAVTIGPEMSVDAQERAIAVDRSLQMLPASLASTTLYETFGELVDGQRGIVEYGDLLERPLDAWKYLLLAVESGEVALRASTLNIDAVLVASSNDRHLEAFREHPAFASFRARLLPIRVPYLLDHRDEQKIYDLRVLPRAASRFAPHATFVAAFWAVCTRLRPAHRESFADAALGRAAVALRPDEKAELYATGRAPARLEHDAIALLEANVRAVHEEQAAVDRYEGRTGASPREVCDLLLDAAAASASGEVTPIDVLDRLEQLCKRTDLEYLQQKPVDGYFDARAGLAWARSRWIERVEQELRDASSLLEDSQNENLFDRYVQNVVQWVKGENVSNPVTGSLEPPDIELMRGVETRLGVRAAEAHRREMLASIASFAIDHPGAAVRNTAVFPRMIAELRESFFVERRRRITTLAEDMLVRLEGAELANEERRRAADAAIERLLERHGYTRTSARVAVGAWRSTVDAQEWERR